MRNIIKNCNNNGHIKGLYFGSCLIGTQNNASFYLNDTDNTNIKWIAGYTTSADWIDSSAVDMIFWSKYLYERKRNKLRRRGKKTEIEMVKHASSEMKNLMPTVFNKLGFNIYYLDSGRAVTAVW